MPASPSTAQWPPHPHPRRQTALAQLERAAPAGVSPGQAAGRTGRIALSGRGEERRDQHPLLAGGGPKRMPSSPTRAPQRTLLHEEFARAEVSLCGHRLVTNRASRAAGCSTVEGGISRPLQTC
jgi:hypothetical protein